MADYKLEADPVVMRLRVSPARLTTVVSEESGQFFAFAFAVLVGLAFGVLDSLTPGLSVWVPEHRAPWWLAGAQMAVFVLLGYFTLRCWPVKNFLRRVIDYVKRDSR